MSKHLTLIAALCACMSILATNIASADTDYFANGTWINGNNHLTTNKNSMGKYSIAYKTPDGDQGSTDFCQKISATVLNCLPLQASVSYNPSTYQAKLISSGSTYIYYVKSHEPKVSALSGTWTPKDSSDPDCNNPEIMVANKIIAPLEYIGTTSFDNATVCFDTDCEAYDTLNLTKDSQGNLVLAEAMYSIKFYLYDKDGNKITNINNIDSVYSIKSHNDYPAQDLCQLIKH